MEITSAGTISQDPMMNFNNAYRNMKAKFRQQSDDNMYSIMAWNSVLSMFQYDEKLYRPELFERILRDTGIVAVIKTTTADYTPVFCNLAGGNRYADGFFKDAICYDMTGKEYKFSDWMNNEKILVFFNNLTYTQDIFIDKYAYMLSEIDTSILSNVIFSRLKPIPVAKDKKTKSQVDVILNDLLVGKMKTILQEFDISDLVENGSAIDVVNLTDVESSKYIQYLQHLHDSIISRLYFTMGLSISDNGKQAQISIDELNKSKSASLSIIQSWFEMRKRGFDKAKEKTGEEWLFDFSDLWKSEIEQQEQNPDDVELVEEKEENQEVATSQQEEKSDE